MLKYGSIIIISYLRLYIIFIFNIYIKNLNFSKANSNILINFKVDINILSKDNERNLIGYNTRNYIIDILFYPQKLF